MVTCSTFRFKTIVLFVLLFQQHNDEVLAYTSSTRMAKRSIISLPSSVTRAERISTQHPSSPPPPSSPTPFYNKKCSSALYSTETEQETSSSSSSPSSSSEPEISDVDARVLQSILADKEKKLDVKTEENMKKLLERGIASRNKENVVNNDEFRKKKKQEEEESGGGGGPYSSTVFKNMSKEGFWNSFRAKTSEILESTKIYFQNRVERDATLLASLGLFAWERAKRDVARGLPSAGKTGVKIANSMKKAAFLLSNNSSFVAELSTMIEDEEEVVAEGGKNDLFEELNTPADEIKKVSEEIRNILSGDKTVGMMSASSTRGLKSLAPAGTSKNAIRQRRAYQRKKETSLKREKEGIDSTIGRLVGGVTDAAWEMQREMKVEGNAPGYRSENVRNAIEGSATNALLTAGDWGKKLLGSSGDMLRLEQQQEEEKVVDVVMDGLLLGGEKWKTEVIEQPPTPPPQQQPPQQQEISRTTTTTATPESLLSLTREDLLEEKARLAACLRYCLERPDQSWMSPSVITSSNFIAKDEKDDTALRQVVIAMICARDAMDVNEEAMEQQEISSSEDVLAKTEYIISELNEMKSLVESIVSMASDAAGENAAETLRSELYGQQQQQMVAGNGDEDESSLLSKLDLIEAAWENVKNQQKEDVVIGGGEEQMNDSFFFGNVQDVSASSSGEAVVEEFKEEEEEVVVRSDVLRAEVVEDAPFDMVTDNQQQQQEPPRSSSSFQDFVENQSKQKVVKDPSPSVEDMMHYVAIDDDDVILDADPVISQQQPPPPPPIMDVVVDINDDYTLDATTKTVSSFSPSQSDAINGDVIKEEEIRTVMADIVTDDEFINADSTNSVRDVDTLSEEEMMKEAQAVASTEENGNKKEEDNLLILVLLRTLDVLFFVTEKFVTLGIPGIIASAKTFQSRVQSVQQDGLGSEGWELLTNVEGGAKRY